jgi:enoyl-CoA hydratase/carnithine racemase
MTDPLVRIDTPAEGVRYVILDDPATRNALGDELLDQLLAALEAARDDPSVRVVVIASSHERIFSSGGNLKAFGDDRPVAEKYAGLDRFPRLFTLLGALGKPVICAAGGDVLAGAFGLALACDLVLAKDSARFGCPEINVGVFPFMISALIYRNIDRMKANELMMMGELVAATEGAALGFVNRVIPDSEFDAEVLRWATTIASKSPLLMHLGKQAIDSTRDMALGEALSALQAQLALAFATDDLLEGVTAFREKREPKWSLR